MARCILVEHDSIHTRRRKDFGAGLPRTLKKDGIQRLAPNRHAIANVPRILWTADGSADISALVVVLARQSWCSQSLDFGKQTRTVDDVQKSFASKEVRRQRCAREGCAVDQHDA